MKADVVASLKAGQRHARGHGGNEEEEDAVSRVVLHGVDAAFIRAAL